MHENSTFSDFEDEQAAQSEETITVCHVSEPHDVHGGRHHHGRQMGTTLPPTKGWLGNPYRVSDHGREECINLFRQDFLTELRDERAFCNAVLSLPNRRVACYCREEDEDEPACHLDVVKHALSDGTVHRIAHDIHNIPLTDEQQEKMAAVEEVL